MRRRPKQRLHLEKTTLRILTDVELAQAHSALRTALCTTQNESMATCLQPEPIGSGPAVQPDPIAPVPVPGPVTVGE